MLISDDNPTGKLISAELELSGGLLYLDTLAHCYDSESKPLSAKRIASIPCSGSAKEATQPILPRYTFFDCLEFISATIDTCLDMIINLGYLKNGRRCIPPVSFV